MSDGGPDLIFLGLGENGHLGFNQPGTPFGQRTWLSYMDDSLDERLRRENRIPQDVKMGGLTLGIKNLMQSKTGDGGKWKEQGADCGEDGVRACDAAGACEHSAAPSVLRGDSGSAGGGDAGRRVNGKLARIVLR